MSVKAKPVFRFDVTNPAAVRAANRQAASMVTRISNDTMQAIRSLITRSISEGIPPYDAARLIEGMVGMTAPQAQAAITYRAELIDSGLEIGRVNTLVDKYVERKIRDRAETIARTEIMDALNDGALEGWHQAQADGLLGGGATKEVMVTPDEKLCPVCEPMDRVAVPLDKPFVTSNGPFMMPPFHPRCRCTAVVNP